MANKKIVEQVRSGGSRKVSAPAEDKKPEKKGGMTGADKTTSNTGKN